MVKYEPWPLAAAIVTVVICHFNQSTFVVTLKL